MRRTPLPLAIAFVLNSVTAMADSLPSTVQELVNLYWQVKDQSLLVQMAQSDNVSHYIFRRVVETTMPQRIAISALRRDLQLGSLSPTSGSTSVVARSGATDLISAAIESGAVARKTDDKSATFSFNALPLYQILSGRKPLGCGTIEEDCRQGVGLYIRGLSGSVTVNTSKSTIALPANLASVLGASGVTSFLTSGKNLQALSARYEFFVRERNAKDAQAALDATAAALSTNATDFGPQEIEFENKLDAVLGTTTSGWRKDTVDALKTADSPARLSEILLARYRLAYSLAAASPEVQSVQSETTAKRLAYITAQNKLLAEQLYRKALTLDYVHQRPSDQPWLHEIRAVVSTPLSRKETDATKLTAAQSRVVPTAMLTLNGSVSLYHHIPIGTAITFGRVRSAQTSLAVDWSPSAWGTVRPTYTAAYYFQYMVENGTIQFNQEAITPGGAAIPISAPAAEVLNTKGPIHVGQIRLSIPLGTTGVVFPSAISYSSRTELITGKGFWQGHLGVTYDLSRLKAFLQSTRTP